MRKDSLQHLKRMHINKQLLSIALIIWFCLAVHYLIRVPGFDRTHDINGHISYSETIARQHKLPNDLNESFEVYQPPLYYLIINAVFPPTVGIDTNYHVNCVRAMSILFGAIVICIIGWILNEVTNDKVIRLLVLLFIATTPKFVFVFTTYNNDTLETLFCIGLIGIGYKLINNWSGGLGILLLLVTVGAFYTKYTATFCVLPLFLICCKNLLWDKSNNQNQKRIIITLIISFIFFVPWLYFHNYLHSKQLAPTNLGGGMYEHYTIGNAKKTLSSILKIPIFQSTPKEWVVPWSYPGQETAHESTKRIDYFSFSFVTSIIGEWILKTPDVIFIWTIFYIHLVAYILGLRQMFKSKITKYAASMVILTHLVHIAFVTRLKLPVWGCIMDYRYICSSWIAWAILYASALSEGNILSKILKVALISGIVIQICIVMTVTGGHSEL